MLIRHFPLALFITFFTYDSTSMSDSLVFFGLSLPTTVLFFLYRMYLSGFLYL